LLLVHAFIVCVTSAGQKSSCDDLSSSRRRVVVKCEEPEQDSLSSVGVYIPRSYIPGALLEATCNSLSGDGYERMTSELPSETDEQRSTVAEGSDTVVKRKRIRPAEEILPRETENPPYV
jgi:hypothetical protein